MSKEEMRAAVILPVTLKDILRDKAPDLLLEGEGLEAEELRKVDQKFID
jgi:hypothetical protein